MSAFQLAIGGLAAVLSVVFANSAAAESPLADAAEKHNVAAVRKLLAERADVRATQADGMTALHWAAYHDDVEMAKRFVTAGADAKTANRYGVTPLSLA